MNEDKTRDLLHKHADEALLIRQMCQHPGFKLLQSKFKEKVQRATSRLTDMSISDDEIKKIRQSVFVWTEIETMLKSLLMKGHYASKMMQDLEVNPLASGEQGE